MKEILSKNEREFLLSSIAQGLRIDGRRLNDMRALKISFGKLPGTVEVQLGRTRVYTSVTCEVTEPRPERPNEGFFVFTTEISPMSSVSVDNSRANPAEVELGRLIERGLKESRAIDTEALCIVAGAKVWTIRTNVHVLDDCGNLLDCASISVITALLHFRKPDVTVIGNDATIHPVDEREPVPLSIHHTPIAITFGFFPNEAMVVDPETKEEMVMDGKLSFYVNIHKEICGVSKGGGNSTTIEQVIKCSKIAVLRATEVTQYIREALHEDIQANMSASARRRNKRVNLEMVEHTVPPPAAATTNNGNKKEDTKLVEKKSLDVLMKDKEDLFEGKASTWDDGDVVMEPKKEDKMETEPVVAAAAATTVVTTKTTEVKKTTKKVTKKKQDSDSEEEDTVVLKTTLAPAPAAAAAAAVKPAKPDEEDSEDLSSALLKKPKKKAAAKKK
eukprot:gene1184-1362_t